MAINSFEGSRVSEGTLQYGAAGVGETAHADVPEQIKNEDVKQPNVPEPGEVQVRNGAAQTGVAENMSERREIGPECNRVQSAGSLIGDSVRNAKGENLGSIEQIMVDVTSGRIAYAVLSFGGFLGLGDKLFAVPWGALRLDEARDEFVLDVDKKTLENAPGFDKGNWPDMADPSFGNAVHAHYGQEVSPMSVPSGQRRVFEQAVTDAGDYIGDNGQPNRSMEFEPVSGYREKKNAD